MTVKIVFLLEEPSMKCYLDQILPRIIPSEIEFQTVRHRGKQDLRASLSRKLSNWREPDKIIRFVVVHDNDNHDCMGLKRELRQICDAICPGVLIRIPCQELEAWYWGDLQAVSEVMKKDVTSYARRRRYRNPDDIANPKAEIKKLFPEIRQQAHATAFGAHAHLEENTSRSFQCFIAGVRELCENS